MWYYYKRLNKRRKRIAYYRRHQKLKEESVGDNANKPNNNEFWITHVKYIGLDGGSYFTKGKIYKVVGEKRYWNGCVFCEIETDVNEVTHTREFFKNKVRKHEEEFELIYNNEL